MKPNTSKNVMEFDYHKGFKQILGSEAIPLTVSYNNFGHVLNYNNSWKGGAVLYNYGRCSKDIYAKYYIGKKHEVDIDNSTRAISKVETKYDKKLDIDIEIQYDVKKGDVKRILLDFNRADVSLKIDFPHCGKSWASLSGGYTFPDNVEALSRLNKDELKIYLRWAT